MPLPADLLQSTQYSNVIATRVSYDHFTREQWTRALYGSRLASALGLRPWADVFSSGETDNLLLSDLSAGIIGVGDPLGSIDASNLRRVMRGDGVLVKPDVPLAPTDDTLIADAAGTTQPMVASTFSSHAGGKALYVFAYQRGAATQASFSPAALGLPGRTYVYDYFASKGRVLPPGARFRDTVRGRSYYIVVPVGASGIGLLGDLDRFVALGSARITQLTDSGQIRVTIAFGKREGAVVLSGYAPSVPHVSARVGRIGDVAYSNVTHLFHVGVSPGSSSAAIIEFSLSAPSHVAGLAN
jgi:hypothetical protein